MCHEDYDPLYLYYFILSILFSPLQLHVIGSPAAIPGTTALWTLDRHTLVADVLSLETGSTTLLNV